MDGAALHDRQQARRLQTNGRALGAAAWDRQDGFFQPGNLRREVTHGDSRFDLAFTLQNEQTGQERPAFMEVKGVTLEENGIVMFPDAPTNGA